MCVKYVTDIDMQEVWKIQIARAYTFTVYQDEIDASSKIGV
jgi:hypothetical protein